MSLSNIKKKVGSIGTKQLADAKRTAFASKVSGITASVLNDWHATASSESALESLGSVIKMNSSFDSAQDASPDILIDKLKNELNMSDRHAVSVAVEVMRLTDGNFKPLNVLDDTAATESMMANAINVVGRDMAAEIMSERDFGLEAFGSDMDSLAVDNRLSVTLAIMRPFDNIMDKGFARIQEESAIVTVKIPVPEVYDYSKTVQANSTSQSRNQGNTTRVRDLLRNPSMVNSAPKKVVAIAANDSNGVLWNNLPAYYTAGKEVQLVDIALDSNTVGFDKADRSDVIAEGGYITAVIIKLTGTAGGAARTEYFSVPTSAWAGSGFVPAPNQARSGERMVLFQLNYPITATTTQYDGSASNIAEVLTDATLQVKLTFTGRVDLSTGELHGNGDVRLSLIKGANVTAIGATTNTMFGTLAGVVQAYSTDLSWDEENQRKANLGIWMNYSTQQFAVPRSRVYLTEYSLSQELDQNAVATTSMVMGVGNGRRGLDILATTLNQVASSNNLAETYPEIATLNRLDDTSMASSQVKPLCLTATVDLSDENVNTMNETTRLSEMSARLQHRLQAMISTLLSKSLMSAQYKGGETPVFKVFTHATIADIILNAPQYVQALETNAATASGADISIMLGKVARLDIIKSSMDCLQSRLIAVPVLESDMESIFTAASIRDCGTVTTNYTPTNGGATVRRMASMSREILLFSNRVGLVLTVTGIEYQLGAYGTVPQSLNTDYVAAITF